MATDQSDKSELEQNLLNRLANIQHKVDSIDQTVAFGMRADREKHEATLHQIFGSSLRRAQIYLAADGKRSVQEIADHLKMKRQNVGPELQSLADEGLLGLVDSQGGRDIWGKKPIDRSLRIAQYLKKRFGLLSSGLSDPKLNKKS